MPIEVSIIIPIYNVERYLVQCLDSVMHQTTTAHYEVICIDDCSSDKSLEVLFDYQQRFPDRLKVHKNENNLGQGATRDYGIRIAQGKYLMFVDGDDYVANDYIETYLSAMDANPCDVIIGGYIDTDGASEQKHLLPNSPWTELCFSSACAKLYRADFIHKHCIQFTDIRYAEDTLFSLYIFAENATGHIIDYAGYYYVINPESTTRNKTYDRKLERELSYLYRSFLASDAYKNLDAAKRAMIEYSYVADMLNTILIYERGLGREAMRDKFEFFKMDIKDLFPNYQKNPFLGPIGPAGQRPKIRFGVAAFMLANRLNMDKALFMLFS